MVTIRILFQLNNRMTSCVIISGYETENLQLSWIDGRAVESSEFGELAATSSFGLCYSEEPPYKILCCDTETPAIHQAHCKVMGN